MVTILGREILGQVQMLTKADCVYLTLKKKKKTVSVLIISDKKAILFSSEYDYATKNRMSVSIFLLILFFFFSL